MSSAANKQQSSGQEPSKENLNRKITFLISSAMDESLNEAAQQLHISVSDVLRKFIREGLAKQQAGEVSAPQPEEGITLTLNERILAAMKTAVDLWGMPAKSLVQLMVAEQLPAYIKRGQQQSDDLTASLNSGGTKREDRQSRTTK